MKAIILTQEAPVYISPFLDDLLTRLRGRHEVVAAFTFAPFGRKGRWEMVKERYCFYGPIGFFRLIALIVQNKLLSLLGKPVSVSNVFRKHSLNPQRPADVNSPEFIERIHKSGADILISIACPCILKAPLLRALPRGCINYHTAALPKYRGRIPMFWALFHREKQIGISVHEMDEKIDNGPIIVQKLLPINPDETLHSLYLKTTAAGPALVVDALDKLESYIPDRIHNDPAIATYFGFPTPEQAREFRRSGGKFF